ALVEGAGFRPVRWFFEMVRPNLDDLPSVELPAGLELRPATPATARRIIEADAEAFRDHWGHTELTEEEVRSVLDDPETDLALWQVAWDGNEVAGAVIVLVRESENRCLGRRRGWLDSVGVRRPWRRRGLATALMVRAMETLRARGLEEAVLGVDADNPSGALGLYERLGFRRTMRFAVYRRPLDEGERAAGIPSEASTSPARRLPSPDALRDEPPLAPDELHPGPLPTDRRLGAVAGQDPNPILELAEPSDRLGHCRLGAAW
ncbi:MAG: hypothetical protein C4307_02585, partial [Chloroflexota bacterium]